VVLVGVALVYMGWVAAGLEVLLIVVQASVPAVVVAQGATTVVITHPLAAKCRVPADYTAVVAADISPVLIAAATVVAAQVEHWHTPIIYQLLAGPIIQ
jgi:hypothetical protein